MINNKNKRGISIMIGYILLVTGAIVMGSIVYQWMKTYVPADSLTCPEGISIYLSEFECSGTSLNITLNINEDKTDRYIFNETIYSIAITPIIFSKDKNDKTRMVSCTNSRIKEELLC